MNELAPNGLAWTLKTDAAQAWELDFQSRKNEAATKRHEKLELVFKEIVLMSKSRKRGWVV